MQAFPECGGKIHRGREAYSCLDGCHALVVITEWREFQRPDFERIKRRLLEPVIFDLRNLFEPEKSQGPRLCLAWRGKTGLVKIALFQMTSVLDYRENMRKIEGAAQDVAACGVRYLFLPECFYSLGDGTAVSPHLVEKGNDHYRRIQDLAKENEIYLLGGSVAALEKGKVINRALNFSPSGEDLGHYDKRFLFRCDWDERIVDEADIYASGSNGVVIEAEPFSIGLGICFDLRYPELGREYTHRGTNLLTYSSAFTVPTGKAHWHTLLRARAIENQCFVVAAAQWGQNNSKISTFGHSLVVGPWGEILVDAGEGEKVVLAEVELAAVERVRKRVIMEH